MTPITFMLAVFAVSFVAGLFGALLGLGGGIIVVPALSLLLGVDIRYAIGASIVSVIATSSGAGAAYLKDHLANIRLAMFLELATTIGAVVGAYAAGVIAGRWLYLIFTAAMLYTAGAMWRRSPRAETPATQPDRWADVLGLHGSFLDARSQTQVEYRITGSRVGFGICGLAGVLSGLLGVGGGIIKVPAMVLGMRVPLKVAAATSNVMIGVTAAASAGVYFVRGDIDPFVGGPTAGGVLAGSVLGARLIGRVRGSTLRAVFTLILLVVAIQMLRRGFAR